MPKPATRKRRGGASTRRAAGAAVALLALVGAGSPAQAAEPSGCVTGGSAGDAAVALYGTGSEVVREERVAGLRTALALEPRIAPGTRHRMVHAGGGRWCDATSGFNAAWKGGPAAAARTYARLAAAPYFDGVTVRAVDRAAPGVYRLRTHALTNGVDATWRIVADRAGVRLATWTATAFARPPFTAQIEGLTALPGASERYRRVAGGLLRASAGLPTERATFGGAPQLRSTYRAPDGFRIHISYANSPLAPHLRGNTGNFQLDIVRKTRRATEVNYEEFLSWGFTKGWVPPDRGYVYINDALGLVCLACVFIANDFQIHLSSFVVEALDLLGYEYRNRYKAYSNVIGHEMFHNFQFRYVKPGALTSANRRIPSFAYLEGTARFQETLHGYSEVSWQPESLVYAEDLNGCNGFDTKSSPDDMDDSMATGPFRDTIYNSCYFWMPWYVSYDFKALRRLVARTMPAAARIENPYTETRLAVRNAVGEGFLRQLAHFAAGALTGHRYRWRARVGGDRFDWARYLDRWHPELLVRGGSSTRTLSNGGLMAHEIRRNVRVFLSGPERARLIVIRVKRGRPRIGYPASGDLVKGPARRQRVFVLAAYRPTGKAKVTMRLERPHKDGRRS